MHNKFLTFKFRKGSIIKIRNIENKEDTSGLGMIWEIFIRRNYTPRGFEINLKDTVIDIGANIGIFSLYASKIAKEGKIYSYEPFNIHYKRLSDNIQLNNLKNIFSFNLAVCEKKGKKDLFISNQSSGMHSLVFNNDSKEKISISCTTLKDIFKENKIKECNFIKIDCEGSEYNILYNSPKNVLNKIKKIALEFDNIDKEKRNCLQLKKFLEQNGFEVKIRGAQQHQGILYAKRLN
jgi:FkbM family methyltransferase